MPTRAFDIYDEQVIEAAFLDTRIGCYFVGTYARRVSFASQQYRSIDLVSALDENEPLRGKTVAVIGAGLAGLMAAVEAKRAGAHVHMFEAEAGVLMRQRKASHRLIHPTVNRWPWEEIRHSTNFHNFDWCASSCNKIIANISAEFDEIHKPERPAKDATSVGSFTLSLDSRLMAYSRDQSAKYGRIRLNNPPTWLTKVNFDYAIVANGYGLENPNARADSVPYWVDDEVLQLRDKAARDPEFADQRFFVTGCGDGGLVDLLRLIHRDFKSGWLTVVVAAALEKTWIAEAIARAERDAMMWARSILARKPRELREAYESSEIVQKLQKTYEQCAEILNNETFEGPHAEKYRYVRELLNASLSEYDLQDRIFLVSPLDQPYAPYSAPIHKLLIAHAKAGSHFTYGKGGYMEPKDGKPPYVAIGSKGEFFPGPRVKVIPRHGPETIADSLIEPEELQSLRLRQIMLADRVDPTRSRGEAHSSKSKLKAKPLSVRKPHVQAMLDELDNRFDVDFTNKGFSYTTVREGDADPECAASLGDEVIALKLPDNLFGIKQIQVPSDLTTMPMLGDD